MKNFICIPLMVSLTLGSVRMVRADEPSADAIGVEIGEVKLKNGSSVRGTIVTVDPGSRVIVIIAGEKSVIPWDQIADVVGGPTTSTTVAPKSESTPVLTTIQDKPILHIESSLSQQVELLRVDDAPGNTNGKRSTVSTYQFICRQPCNRAISVRQGDQFVMAGPNVLRSDPFRLDGVSGPVTAQVKAAPVNAGSVGILFTGLGASNFILGSGLMAMAHYSSTSSQKDPLVGLQYGIGGLMLTIGALFVTAGIAGLSMPSTTEVQLVKPGQKQTGIYFDHGILRF